MVSYSNSSRTRTLAVLQMGKFTRKNPTIYWKHKYVYVLLRENIDAQAAPTDGRATLYANGQAHMFERKKGVIKKQRGGV